MDFTIPTPVASESSVSLALIQALALESHVEGGYFRRIYLHSTTIPASIFMSSSPASSSSSSPSHGPSVDFESNGEIETRAASSSIHYLLTSHSPIGHFHRNKSVILHSLHRGRGRCILINEDGRVESFVVGHGVERGEKCMWIVDGGVWRASFLEEGTNGRSDGGLLITEVVVPGFDFKDHEFLKVPRLIELVGEEAAGHLAPVGAGSDTLTFAMADIKRPWFPP